MVENPRTLLAKVKQKFEPEKGVKNFEKSLTGKQNSCHFFILLFEPKANLDN
jgi:hypothetical protein